jgi:hypothetical protein
MIVAVSLLMIIPATILFMNYTSDSKASVISSQVFKIGNELIVTGEQMYSVGHNSWQTIELLIPEELISVKVFNGSTSELVLSYGDPVSDVVLFSNIPLFNEFGLDCTLGCDVPLHPGPNRIRVKSTSITTASGVVGVVRYELVE